MLISVCFVFFRFFFLFPIWNHHLTFPFIRHIYAGVFISRILSKPKQNSEITNSSVWKIWMNVFFVFFAADRAKEMDRYNIIERVTDQCSKWNAKCFMNMCVLLCTGNVYKYRNAYIEWVVTHRTHSSYIHLDAGNLCACVFHFVIELEMLLSHRHRSFSLSLSQYISMCASFHDYFASSLMSFF